MRRAALAARMFERATTKRSKQSRGSKPSSAGLAASTVARSAAATPPRTDTLRTAGSSWRHASSRRSPNRSLIQLAEKRLAVSSVTTPDRVQYSAKRTGFSQWSKVRAPRSRRSPSATRGQSVAASAFIASMPALSSRLSPLCTTIHAPDMPPRRPDRPAAHHMPIRAPTPGRKHPVPGAQPEAFRIMSMWRPPAKANDAFF